MTSPSPYKTTLFDRLGPDARDVVRPLVYGAAGLTLGFVFGVAIAGEILHLSPWYTLGFALGFGLAIGGAIALVPLMMARASERAYVALMVSGSSTPYVEQYSYQQALVMQGRLDEALSSFEAIIAEPEATIEVRIRTAELYDREAKRPERAGEIFREAIRDPRCTPGQEAYLANRLADLYTGPLGQPGKALVELRRLADRYPNTPVAERAVLAIRSIKAMIAEREAAAND